MRLPDNDSEAIELLRYGFDQGITYFDTAPYYCDSRSEGLVGEALKGHRDEVVLSTKVPIKTQNGKDVRPFLEESLRRLQTDHIDIYHMWSLNKEHFDWVMAPGGHLEEAIKAKQEGLIRHLAFSFHDTPEVLMEIIDTGAFESMTVQYNLLDRKNEQAIQHAHERGMAVCIMGSVGGGRLGYPSPEVQKLLPGKTASNPELALRFVLSHPGVTVALSGMGNKKMVAENVRTASLAEHLSAEERQQLEAATAEKQRLADLYCTGCKYCQPCPNGIDIPANFELLNYHRLYGLTDYARQEYRELAEKAANHCLGCQECEPKCPQHLRIAEELAKVAETLG
jgi:predicted aldo/keto reductase-like oxidoreductase